MSVLRFWVYLCVVGQHGESKPTLHHEYMEIRSSSLDSGLLVREICTSVENEKSGFSSLGLFQKGIRKSLALFSSLISKAILQIGLFSLQFTFFCNPYFQKPKNIFSLTF